MLRRILAPLALSLTAIMSQATAQTDGPPGRPGLDAPELARLGPYAVGVADVALVQKDQTIPVVDAARTEQTDRHLPTKVWYPAAATGPGTVYHSALAGQDGKDVAFSVPGLATPNAKAAAGHFPLVIVAHGYSNTPEALSWLGENLASKGYVVVMPAFRDPAISIRTANAMAIPLTRRPLDITFVAREAGRRARAGEAPFASANPDRTALIGYSMGGYGVLTVAGAPLDPRVADATHGALAPYVAGGAQQGDLGIAGLKAMVAISPANDSRGALKLWAPPGVGAIHVPTFFIVGSQDHTVGYDPGVRTVFDNELHAPRYLLTFREASHSIALIDAPPEMRKTFWDEDWFVDSVWRKDRLIANEEHFITAFLDRYVKDETAKASYIDGQVLNSDDGTWANAPGNRYSGYSPGPPAATLWKGFQPNRSAGMALEFKPAN